MILLLDSLAMCAALLASWLWYASSRSNMRRVSHDEAIDHHDYNRVVVSFNRTQVLNSRAALASAVSALLVAVRFAVGIFAV